LLESQRSKRIGIVFCGGCNPRIDRGKVAAAVRQALPQHGYNVVFNAFDVDFIIYLSGCTVSCAARDGNSDLPQVTVAATTVDADVVKDSELADRIISKVKKMGE
jgi:dissimilatory sulfite reductase (desulfoviridin) alpha/beta subunit